MDDNEYLKKTQCLDKTLNSLVKEVQLNQDTMDGYIHKFKFIYSNGFRHDYSKITRILYNIEKEKDLRDYMASNIKDIYNECKKRDRESKSSNESMTTKSLRKLSDHINLENIRLTELITISQKVSDTDKVTADASKELEKDKKSISELHKKVATAEKQMTTISNNMKNSTTESITILSIFAGIVMAFTGGFSYISQALVSLNSIGPYRAATFIILVGIILFDVIFLLLYMIAKIIECPIVSCKERDNECKEKSILCAFKRYPYIAYFNFIACIFLITAINFYWIDRYNYLSKIYVYIFNDFKFLKLSAYIPLILLFGITYTPLYIIYIKSKNHNCVTKDSTKTKNDYIGFPEKEIVLENGKKDNID